jgi:hypothetical protein
MSDHDGVEQVITMAWRAHASNVFAVIVQIAKGGLCAPAATAFRGYERRRLTPL